ncbi:zinc finger and BTB domain-containing protein 17-like, partial [Mizuhopecten yessoensis]
MVYQELMQSSSHVTSLASSLYQLQQRGYICDCTIQTCQANLNVHQVVLLASGSPYFRKQLCRVTNTGQVDSSSVLLKDQDLFVVQAVVQFMYTGEMYITPCNVDKVFNVCSLLGLEEAVKLCQMFRQTHKCSTDQETLKETADSGLESSMLKEKSSLEVQKHFRSENIVLQKNIISRAAKNDVTFVDMAQPNIPSSTRRREGSDKGKIDTNFNLSRSDEGNNDNSDIQTKEFCEDEDGKQEAEYAAPLLRSTAARANKPDSKSQQDSIILRSQKAKCSLTKSDD